MENQELLRKISNELESSRSIADYSGNQGRLFTIDIEEKTYLIKSANIENWWSKSINKWSIKREYRVYKKLEGLNGIPKCYGLTDEGWLVLEYIDGGSYRDKQFELDGNDHFKWSTDVLSAGSNFTMQVMFKTTNTSWYGSMPLYNTFGPSDRGFWHHFQQNGTLGSTLGTMGTANSNDGVGICLLYTSDAADE